MALLTARLREVVTEPNTATGPQFPIAFRFSQWKGSDYNARIAEDPAELSAFSADTVLH
jgi:hypothetical protein